MDKHEFYESLKSKNTSALFDLIKLEKSGKTKIDPDFLDALIEELNEREL